MRTQRVNGRRALAKMERRACGLYIALFCSNPSRTRVLRTSDAVEVLVRTPAARPLRAEQRCVGDRASWSSSSGCTSPYARCRGRRASSAPGERPRTESRLRARTRCLAKSSCGGRAALRRMCRARNEDEWTVAPGQRDEVSDDASVDDAGGNDDVPDLASCSSSETEPPTARPTSEPSPEAMTEPTSSTSEPTAEPTFEPTSGAPTAEPAVELGTPRDGVGIAVGALPEGGEQPGVPVVVAFGAGFGAGIRQQLVFRFDIDPRRAMLFHADREAHELADS